MNPGPSREPVSLWLHDACLHGPREEGKNLPHESVAPVSYPGLDTDKPQAT